MKRFAKIILLLVLASILCSVLVGCVSAASVSAASDASRDPSIVYGKKYVSEENGEKETSMDASSRQECLVFNKDHTGYFERRYVHRSYIGDQSTSIYSGKVDFVWRVADDNRVYIFQTKVTYDEDDNSGEWSFETSIICGDEFLVAGGVRYILEGSDLEKSLEK
ncbi:MAG: hypothetical protein J6Z13_08065 [Clostridia bacterium]|nr:hypothetical protein [Clostridia bacterium]